MDSEYVVEVDVTGFAVEGDVAVDGSRVTAKQAGEANDEKLNELGRLGAEVVAVLVRDDGTGILYFRWDPPGEAFEDADGEPVDRITDAKPVEGGANTWQSAKLYTEQVVSSAAGAGFSVVEHRITTRAREDGPDASEQPSPPSTASDASPEPRRRGGKSGAGAAQG